MAVAGTMNGRLARSINYHNHSSTPLKVHGGSSNILPVRRCRSRRVGTAAGDGEDPSGGVNDVWELRGRQSAQQNITDEISTGVADVMDIDRTPELLIYIWQHFFGKKDKQLEDEEQQQQQLAASQSATTSSTVAPAAEQAAAATAAAAAAPVEVPPGVPPPAPPGLQVATLGGGCFWGLEACMQAVKGVVQLQSGYAGGTAANPNYKQVCAGGTGHAEVVRVVYDPTVLPFDRLLQLYFSAHDPTTLNRQGSDKGSQYRSLVCCHSADQQASAQRVLWRLQGDLIKGKRSGAGAAGGRSRLSPRIAGAAAVLPGSDTVAQTQSPAAAITAAAAAAAAAEGEGDSGPLLPALPPWEQDVLVTELLPANGWQYWPAERYHHSFYNLNSGQGYCQRIIKPRLQRFRDMWAGRDWLNSPEEQEE